MASMQLCSLNTSPVSEVLTLSLHWRYHAAGFFRKHPVLTVPAGGDVMLRMYDCSTEAYVRRQRSLRVCLYSCR